MATKKDEYKDKFTSRRNKTSSVETAPKRKVPAEGAKVLFDTVDNAAKQVEAETIEEIKVKSQPIPEVAPKKQTKTTATPSKKKKTTAAKTKPAPVEEKKEGGELIKTSIYIEEENFLAMEELQLKLKRKEKRRVTKNELFNKAIKLLIEHHGD